MVCAREPCERALRTPRPPSAAHQQHTNAAATRTPAPHPRRLQRLTSYFLRVCALRGPKPPLPPLSAPRAACGRCRPKRPAAIPPIRARRLQEPSAPPALAWPPLPAALRKWRPARAQSAQDGGCARLGLGKVDARPHTAAAHADGPGQRHAASTRFLRLRGGADVRHGGGGGGGDGGGGSCGSGLSRRRRGGDRGSGDRGRGRGRPQRSNAAARLGALLARPPLTLLLLIHIAGSVSGPRAALCTNQAGRRRRWRRRR